MKRLFFLLSLLFLANPAWAASTYSSPQSKATLFALPSAKPNTVYAALKIELTEPWHTYWQNPGHAGLPPQFGVTTSPALAVSPTLELPVPERIENGQLVTFGYHKSVWLLREISVPAANANNTFTLASTVRYLVCSDQCLQEKAELTTTFSPNSVTLVEKPSGIWQRDLGALDPVLEKSKDGQYLLHIYRNIDGDGGWVVNLQITDFFPAKGMPIDLAKPTIEERSIEHDVIHLKTTDLTTRPAKFQGLLVGKDRSTGAISGFWVELDWPLDK